jgi:hypothetical protein
LSGCKSLKKGSEVVPMHPVKACETSSTLVPRSAGFNGGSGGQDYVGVRINLRNLRSIAHIFTPWSRVLFEKLAGSQLVKKFLAFNGTRRFITAYTRARHLSLS